MVSSIFLTQMGRLDSGLFVELDKILQRFVVRRRDRQNKPRDILVIENPNGEFCYPNYEHIVKLFQIDTWRNKNIIKDIDRYNDSLERVHEEGMHELSDEISKLATRSAYY